MSNPTELMGTVETWSIESKYLQSSREIQVYLPHSYSPLYSYPVLYVNDGDDYLRMGRMITQLNQRFHKPAARLFIAVFVPVEKQNRRAEYHPEGELHAAFIRFFAEELVPAIESRYSTIPLAAARGILGSSLGATAGLHTILTYPRTFHHLLSQSGAYRESSLSAVRGRTDLATLACYQSIGLAEESFQSSNGKVFDLLAANREMNMILLKNQMQVAYQEHEGDHTWGYWQEDLPMALDHFAEHSQ